MPTPSHEAYTIRMLERLAALVRDPEQIERVEEVAEAAEVLLLLDLEPARARLESGYAPKPRGGKPRDCVGLWRVMLLGILIGEVRYNALVRRFRGNKVLRVVAGLADDDVGPGVGTLYDFEHRLHDGRYRAPCAHAEAPSVTERRRATTAQPKRETAAAAKRAGRARPPVATAASVVEEIRSRAAQAMPDDLVSLLNELLLLVAVVPSARAGALGDLTQLTVACDTSILPTGAAFHGTKTCEHPRFERCDCGRVYSDPDATVGYDANGDRMYFGHRFAEVTCGTRQHDLPLAIELNTANVPDVIAGPLIFERLGKMLATNLPDAAVDVAVLDAGFDAEAVHAHLREMAIRPVIPLKSAAPAHHPTRPDLVLSPRGVPLCAAGVEMAPAGSAGPGTKMFTCALRVGRIAACPLAPAGAADWHCRPDLKAGPSVAVRISDNPRLTPAIARNSDEFVRLYKTRTTSERSNSLKKVKFKLLSARRRRRSGWQILLMGMAVVQHALAWLSDAGPPGRRVHALVARARLAARIAA